MKIIFKKILQYYLKYITKLVLLVHRPTIIAIAGSTNKTFVKDDINKMLEGEGISVRSNFKSFNTEIGLPLAILNLPSGYNSYKNWPPIIFKAALQIFKISFPKFLVLELGVSNPRDMKYLLSIIKPKIVVVTDITQRYLESFDDMDKLVKEYEYLVKNIKKTSLSILNYDNIRVKNLANVNQNIVEYFGVEDGANWQAVEIKREDHASLTCLPAGRSYGGASRGQTIKVNHNDIVEEYKINRFGKHHVCSLLISLIIKDYVQKTKKI